MLEELPGHTRVKERLERLKTFPPKALLFEGPKGVGKALFAKEFARFLVLESCLNRSKSDPLPDLKELHPEGKSFLYCAKRIRHLIKEVFYPPFESKRKLFIIHEADRMLPSSSHALLKTLEEPPSYAHFILISSHPEAILKTVRSRLLAIPFFSLSFEEITDHLEKQLKMGSEKARQIAWLAHGNVAKAEALAKREDQFPFPLIAEIGAAALRQDYPSLFHLIAKLDLFSKKSASFELIEEILSAVYYWYRDLHLLSCGYNCDSLFFRSHEEKLRESLEYPLPGLSEIQERMGKVEQARSLNIGLVPCLTHLLLV